MKKEFRISFEALGNSEQITKVNKRLFKEHGLDLQRHEADLEDDYDREERIYRVQPERKYFFTR